MIDLRDGMLTYNLPPAVADTPEVQAIAYAVNRQLRRLASCADASRTWSMIDALPEPMLDMLAVEFRTPAYRQTYPITTKRTLLKGTLRYYMTLGTPEAAGAIVRAVFGEGRIVEWFEYDGQPHHFMVSTTNPAVTANDMAELRQILDRVKRLSSWLDGLIVEIAMPAVTVRAAGVTLPAYMLTRLPGIRFDIAFHKRMTAAAAVYSVVQTVLPAI